MTTSANLGRLQADIYFWHDEMRFDELSNTVKLIFEQLAVDKNTSGQLGDLISNAYQLADKAEDAMRANNPKREHELYSEALQKLTEAEEILNYKKGTAFHQIKWWQYFRHKKMVKVVYHIFLQQLKPYGISGIPKALSLSYYLVMVGVGHNKRDKELSAKYAEKYWDILLTNKGTGYPFLG